MRDTERRARLVEQLRVDGRAGVPQLATALGVTASTIRRDLDRLAREGRVVRTYGGAALSDGLAQRGRTDPRDGTKRAIARAAASPTLTRYSKSPEHAYDRELRKAVLDAAERRFGEEIHAGLSWCAQLAARQPMVARALALFDQP